MTSEREIIDRTVKCVEDLVKALVAEAMLKIERLVRKVEAAQQDQRWFTVKEAAEILGKSAYTIREYVKEGRLEAKRVSTGAGGKGEWRISREAIDRFREPKDSWPVDCDSGVPAKMILTQPSGNGHPVRGR